MQLIKLTTTAAIVFISFVSLSQDFVGKDVYLYKGTTVKPATASSEGLTKYMYRNFFVQFDTVTKVLTEAANSKKRQPFKPFQVGDSYTALSDYNKMRDQQFKVVGLYELTPKSEYYKDQYVILALENSELGTIYYKYDTKYKHDLEIEVVGGFNFPDGYFCTKLTVNIDKFNSKTRISSEEEGGISFLKSIEGKDTSIYISLNNRGESVTVDGKGVIILFEDGTKIERPSEKIDVKVGEKSGYIYHAFVSLTKEELEMLATKKITDTRLYIYDRNIKPESQNLIMQYAKCMAK